MSAFFRLLPLLPLGLLVSLLGLYGGIHLLHGATFEGLVALTGALGFVGLWWLWR